MRRKKYHTYGCVKVSRCQVNDLKLRWYRVSQRPLYGAFFIWRNYEHKIRIDLSLHTLSAWWHSCHIADRNCGRIAGFFIGIDF